MEGHASLMYFTEEVRHDNTFPLKLLQFIVSRGKSSSLPFAYGKRNSAIRTVRDIYHIVAKPKAKFNGQACLQLNGF